MQFIIPQLEGIRIEETRPFVEVNINGEDYLVDSLIKRILKSNWFKENYDFEVKNQQTIRQMNKKRLRYYKEAISEHNALSTLLPFLLLPLDFPVPNDAEKRYEIEQSKKFFPEEWEKYELIKQEMKDFRIDFNFQKKKSL